MTEKDKDIKLDFELVPDGCWYSNLRSILSKKAWDYVKKDAKERAGGRCTICGRKTDRLEAHERWYYDEKTNTQKLVDVIAVCHDCHSVIHIGRTSLMGNIERAEKHYMKVNNCTYAEYRKRLGEATKTHKRLNAVSEWKLDVTYLKRYIQEDN